MTHFLYDAVENFIYYKLYTINYYILYTINFPLTSITSKVFYDDNIKITEHTLYMIICKYIIVIIMYIVTKYYNNNLV